MKIRMVDTESESYYIANRYMIRLRKEDFDDPHELARYAATAGMELEEFRKQFYYIVEDSQRESEDKSDGRAVELENGDEAKPAKKTKNSK
jgi:6-phosphofructokinase 1